MACAAEHWYGLDYALQHTTWVPPDRFGHQGWQTGGDLLNRLTVLPDHVGDWLWQKHPFAPSVLGYGVERVRVDLRSGDRLAAALKLALVTHYLADIVAVSHTWLEFIGDDTDYVVVDGRSACKHFHDPVEIRVAALLPEWPVPPPSRPSGPWSEAIRTGIARAYALGRELFDAYFAGVSTLAPAAEQAVTPPLDCLNAIQRCGVINAAQAVWYLWELVADETDSLPWQAHQVEHWTLQPVLDWTADEIRERLADPATVPAFHEAQGWAGGALFAATETISPAAQEQLAVWKRERQAWRSGPMAGVLPAKPTELIRAAWRP